MSRSCFSPIDIARRLGWNWGYSENLCDFFLSFSPFSIPLEEFFSHLAGSSEFPSVPQLLDRRVQSAPEFGETLPGFNDGFAGSAPDPGGYESGQALPHYGPRPRKPGN